MPIQSSDRFLKVLRGQSVDRTPAWLMRQAGRYLPEYRATRSRSKDFIDMCKTPEFGCEVTLQPLERYPLDAAILFQDILTLPMTMGAPLRFGQGLGPIFDEPIRALDDLNTLDPTGGDFSFVGEEIHLIKRALDGRLPLIGFCGSPWTVATYMIEGMGTKTFSTARGMIYKNRALVEGLLEQLTSASINYLSHQIEAGVDCVMIFDTWGGLLAHDEFESISLNPVKKILAALSEKYPQVPTIVYTKQGAPWYPKIAACGATAMGADWSMSLSDVRAMVGDEIVLQGNLDPCILYGDETLIQAKVEALMQSSLGRHIFNLGHGLSPDMEPDKVGYLLECLQTTSARYAVANEG